LEEATGNVKPSFVVPNGTDGYDFVFKPGATFSENLADGTATLTGEVISADMKYGFKVSFMFSGRTNTPGPGNPFFSYQSGCTPPTNDWHYYTSFVGTLTGTNNYAGAVINVASFMHFFQVGAGASTKNLLPGGGGWFEWIVVKQPNTGPRLVDSCPQTDVHGDLNFNTFCP